MERQNLPAEPDFSLIIVGADAEAEKRAANRDMVQAGECWRPAHGYNRAYGDRQHRVKIVDIEELSHPGGED